MTTQEMMPAGPHNAGSQGRADKRTRGTDYIVSCNWHRDPRRVVENLTIPLMELNRYAEELDSDRCRKGAAVQITELLADRDWPCRPAQALASAAASQRSDG
jgi:hypothetical protein